MNNLQNVLVHKFDDKLCSEKCNLVTSKKVNFSETFFAIILAVVGAAGIWKAICLIVLFTSRIN